MRIFWASSPLKDSVQRFEWAQLAVYRMDRAQRQVTLSGADGPDRGFRAMEERIQASDIVVADFASGGGLAPDVVTAATLGRYCWGKPTYILTDESEDVIPFDWKSHGQWVRLPKAAEAQRERLVAWFLAMVTGVKEPPKLPAARKEMRPPEVFVAMPFQGYIRASGRDPIPSRFDFSRFLGAVDSAVARLEMDPRPVVTIVGKDRFADDILEEIKERIATASVVIADFTPDERSNPRPNANVITEAAIARSAFRHELSLLLCARAGQEIPICWTHFNRIEYDADTLECTNHNESLSKLLARGIAAALASGPGSGRPSAVDPGHLPGTPSPGAHERQRDFAIRFNLNTHFELVLREGAKTFSMEFVLVPPGADAKGHSGPFYVSSRMVDEDLWFGIMEDGPPQGEMAAGRIKTRVSVIEIGRFLDKARLWAREGLLDLGHLGAHLDLPKPAQLRYIWELTGSAAKPGFASKIRPATAGRANGFQAVKDLVGVAFQYCRGNEDEKDAPGFGQWWGGSSDSDASEFWNGPPAMDIRSNNAKGDKKGLRLVINLQV